MIIASIVKTRERFMGIGQVITLPLFFASNAIYPISIMPGWLQVVADSQSVELYGGRASCAHVAGTTAGVGFDIVILAFVALDISTISAWMYPKVVIPRETL